MRLRGRSDRCASPPLNNRARLLTGVFTFDPRASIEPAVAPRVSRRAGTPSRPNLAKTRVTPHPHLVQTSVATDFSSTPAELPGDVHAAFVDPTRPRVPL